MKRFGWRVSEQEYGRHEETRTPDLYRVKVRLTHTSNNFEVLGPAAKPL